MSERDRDNLRWLGAYLLKGLVASIAAAFNGLFLIAIFVDLLDDGNLNVSGGPAHAVSTASALFMLVGFSCSLACAVRMYRERP